jgi:hypothetical protein
LVYEGADHRDPFPASKKLVAYDFRGSRIPRAFYWGLRRLFDLARDGELVQYSVVVVRRMRTAKAIMALARMHGCVNVRTYVVRELKP